MPSGKIESNMAKSFSVLSDKTILIYVLRDGLACDDGTLINEMPRMHYFAFWHGDSFFSKSQYGIHDFISSGPYSVSKDSTNKKVVLTLRKDWLSYIQRLAEKLISSYVSI